MQPHAWEPVCRGPHLQAGVRLQNRGLQLAGGRLPQQHPVPQEQPQAAAAAAAANSGTQPLSAGRQLGSSNLPLEHGRQTTHSPQA